MAQVTSLRSIELYTPHLDEAARFYEEHWGLELVERDAGAIYLRATGPEHHVLVLRQGDAPGVARLNFGVADRTVLDELFAKVEAGGARVLAAPGAVNEPGEGYGFRVADPEGREVCVAAGVAEHVRGGRAGAPAKVSHVVLNSRDAESTSAFYCDLLGFRVRDRTKGMNFLGCNSDHHSLAFTRLSDEASLHHVAYELPNIDAVMRGAGRLKRSGIGLEWGVGRHGPGNNVFAYFYDPCGFVVEYTTEMQQVDDAVYRVGTPQDWDRPSNSDQWGVAGPPSNRFLRHSPPRA